MCDRRGPNKFGCVGYNCTVCVSLENSVQKKTPPT